MQTYRTRAQQPQGQPRPVRILRSSPALGCIAAALLIAASVAPSALAAEAGAAAPSAATLHALGVLIEKQQLADFDLSASEFRAVAQGFADGYRNPDAVKDAVKYVPQLRSLVTARVQEASQREQRAGERFLDHVANLPHARKTASGMVYVPIVQGSGAAPRNGDTVTVQYTGRFIDGTVFDSSAQHGGTATFKIGQIIPCWTEGLQLMKVGGKARLVCPASLAYGQRGAGGVIKPGSTLDFDVQLLAVRAGPPVPLPGGLPPGVTGAPR